MESPTYFYHTTSPDNERLIKENNCLKPQKHQHSKWKCLVKDCSEYVSVPDGVWFSATLVNGALPLFSPYGARRVKIPIKSVIQQLGGKVRLYEGVTFCSSRSETYVRLMLVREDATFEVLQHMKDVADNPCLKLTGEYKVARLPTWLDVYVPYPIDVSSCSWDYGGVSQGTHRHMNLAVASQYLAGLRYKGKTTDLKEYPTPFSLVTDTLLCVILTPTVLDYFICRQEK